jgi:sodium-independent sulfate anion transporter 11
MASIKSKIGHSLAKLLGIDLHYRHETGSDRVTRGESAFSIESADTYVEREPSAADWLHEIIPSGQDVLHYIISLFPFLHWIGRYNVQWLIGDLVAGSPDIQSTCKERVLI